MKLSFVSFALGICALLPLREGASQESPKPNEKRANPLERIEIQVVPNANDASRVELSSGGNPAEMSDDERAIRSTAVAYVDAFNAGNASTAAGMFAVNAEYIDPEGNHYRGREQIQQLLSTFFERHPERRLDLAIDSIHFPAPNVAIEDGLISVNADKASPASIYQYSAVHVKQDGAWQTVSVRDRPAEGALERRSQLRDLAWLLGEWVHEGPTSVVHFKCRPTDSGMFFVREFSVHIDGQEAMVGNERIGWDPRASRFRTWVFDSDGGFSEGYWQRQQDGWSLTLDGVAPDGQTMTCTSLYRFVDANTVTFQTVEHRVGNTQLPDGEAVTIVRVANQPQHHSAESKSPPASETQRSLDRQ